MNTRHDELIEAEQDQHDLEAELAEREAELSGHEARLLAQLQQFEQRNGALLAFSGYVRDEERSLMRRADALGPAAASRVAEALSGVGTPPPLALAPDELIAERLEILSRRRELYAMRLELMDAREQLHEACVDHFEGLERDVSGLEGALVRRQQALGAAARAIFMGAGSDASPVSGVRARPLSIVKSAPVEPSPSRFASLLGGFDEPPARPVAAPSAGDVLRDVPAVRAQGPIELAPDLDIVAVHPGPGPDATSTRPEGPAAPAAQPASLPADPDRQRPRLAPIRVTLDVSLDAGTSAFFYVERGQHPDALPGVFVATPNLLKVDREVRVRLSRGGSRLELNARVVWRETHDPSGMGVELTDVGDAERQTLRRWATELPPRARPVSHPN